MNNYPACKEFNIKKKCSFSIHTIKVVIKTLLTFDEHRSKIHRNSVFDCHFLPVGQQMAIENSSCFWQFSYLCSSIVFTFSIAAYLVWYWQGETTVDYFNLTRQKLREQINCMSYQSFLHGCQDTDTILHDLVTF